MIFVYCRITSKSVNLDFIARELNLPLSSVLKKGESSFVKDQKVVYETNILNCRFETENITQAQNCFEKIVDLFFQNRGLLESICDEIDKITFSVVIYADSYQMNFNVKKEDMMKMVTMNADFSVTYMSL